MKPFAAFKEMLRQRRFYRSLRGSAFSRMAYFAQYYFVWIFLRWGDRHSRALQWLRRIGLSDRRATVQLPDKTKLTLDNYTIHQVLYSIYSQRVYEPDPRFLPKKGDVVLDIGAQQGIYCCRAARLVGPEGRVFAFEPHPINYGYLQRNVQQNHLENVTAYAFGLFDKSGTFPIHVHPFSVNHSLINTGSETTVEITCMTLDECAKRFSLPPADLVKIDVEGAELKVLEGGVAYLRQSKPRITMEYEIYDDLPKMKDLLEGLSYDAEVRPGYIYAVPRRTR